MTRGVEALEQRPDAAIKDDDMHYLQQHGIKNLLSSTLQELLKCRTVDPIQFIIDCMKLGVDKAAQDPKLQIAVWRVDKLAEVFAFIDQEGTGSITFQGLQKYSQRFGGRMVPPEELGDIFSNFDADQDLKISLEEFRAYFARACRAMGSEEFNMMTIDMLAA